MQPTEYQPAPKPEKTTGPWTDEEIAILREHYPRGGSKGAARSLPHRTLGSIRLRAHKLNLARINKNGSPRKNGR